MFHRRQAQRLEIEVTARGLTVCWECSPGVVVRRLFPSASTGCAASEALRKARPATVEETIAILDGVARERLASHGATASGPSARLGRTNLHRRA